MSDFTLSFSNFKDKTEKQLDTIIRKTAIQLTTAIIKDTPVDSGRLRGNWQVSIDKEDTSEAQDKDKNGSATISKAVSELSKPFKNVIYIQNNLPYASRIEYGYSKVKSPAGMVRINIVKFSKYLREATRVTK